MYVIYILLRVFDLSIDLVLLLEFSLDVFEALFDFASYLFLWCFLEIQLLEKRPMLIPNEVQDFTLGEARHLMTVLPMSIKQPVNLDFTIQ